MAESGHQRAEGAAAMVEHVGVCGAGIMGSGIAQVFAAAGYAVLFYDKDPVAVERGLAAIDNDLEQGVSLGKVEPDDAVATRNRVQVVDELGALSGAGLVVEAVAEHLEVKQDVFSRLDVICPPPALLVTNTSTLSQTEIASVLEDPGRAAGYHFFNPATRMKLVEIIPLYDTRPGTVAALVEISNGIGKIPVVVRESPGGIVSRLQLLVRNEAVRLLAEGVASAEDIDTAMKLGAGWPMGPLELCDLVGLDLHVENSDRLADEMGDDRYRPPPLVRKIVRAGHLGRKSGRGFHTYGSE